MPAETPSGHQIKPMHTERASELADHVKAQWLTNIEYLQLTFPVMVEVRRDGNDHAIGPWVISFDDTEHGFEKAIGLHHGVDATGANKKVVYHGGDFSPENVQFISSQHWEATLRLIKERGGKDKIQVFAN